MPLLRIALLLILFPAVANVLAEQQMPPDARHPADTALMQQEDGTWIYRSFPAGSQLFVFAGDAPGKSNCNRGCISAWPPLLVSDDDSAEQVGAWTIIVRDDGRRQWAYKGQPVYRRYHDLPAEPREDGFQLLKP